MSQQLRDWLHSTKQPARESAASEAGTSVAYLWQLAGGHRKASLELAKRLQEATRGNLTIAGLRPDVFGEHPAA